MSELALQRVRDAEMRIADTPVPVYRETRKGTPELIGSAVLIQIADRRFICTAAHVLDERNGSNLYLPEGSMLQTFAAQFRVTQVPASGRRDDKFDFAIAELVSENGDRFARYRFLT